MCGVDVLFRRALEQGQEHRVAICMRQLGKNYADNIAVADATFAIDWDECFGLLGHNGAVWMSCVSLFIANDFFAVPQGKSTIANMLSGLIEPSWGEAYVDGMSIRDEIDEIHNVLGVCPQHVRGLNLLAGWLTDSLFLAGLTVALDDTSGALNLLCPCEGNVRQTAEKSCAIHSQRA